MSVRPQPVPIHPGVPLTHRTQRGDPGQGGRCPLATGAPWLGGSVPGSVPSLLPWKRAHSPSSPGGGGSPACRAGSRRIPGKAGLAPRPARLAALAGLGASSDPRAPGGRRSPSSRGPADPRGGALSPVPSQVINQSRSQTRPRWSRRSAPPGATHLTQPTAPGANRRGPGGAGGAQGTGPKGSSDGAGGHGDPGPPPSPRHPAGPKGTGRARGRRMLHAWRGRGVCDREQPPGGALRRGPPSPPGSRMGCRAVTCPNTPFPAPRPPGLPAPPSPPPCPHRPLAFSGILSLNPRCAHILVSGFSCFMSYV